MRHLWCADLGAARLIEANLRGANLFRANFDGANLREADLIGADLSGAILERAVLVGTNMEDSTLTGCHVYGISAWDLRLDRAIQSNLIINQEDQPNIQVDNLEVAQFIYLLLNNKKIRDGKRTVLILGRFTKERKAVLDAIREALRHSGRASSNNCSFFPKTRKRELSATSAASAISFVVVPW